MLFKAFAAFLALFMTDVCWAIYVRRVKDGDPVKAAGWAVVLFVFGALAIISYVSNRWLIIPAALGAYLGTYVAVWYDTVGQEKLEKFTGW